MLRQHRRGWGGLPQGARLGRLGGEEAAKGAPPDLDEATDVDGAERSSWLAAQDRPQEGLPRAGADVGQHGPLFILLFLSVALPCLASLSQGPMTLPKEPSLVSFC